MNTLIKQYINKIDINIINDFALKNNITLNKKELDILYDIVKNKHEEILYGDDTNVKTHLKNNLEKDNYNKIIKLYENYKEKFAPYLL